MWSYCKWNLFFFIDHTETQHQFNARENDWGFTSFMPLGDLYDPSKGFLVNDTCLVEAEVAVYKAMDPWLYDSKKETGFVGLKNQGATCYMNSLLQTLYHIPCFRKVRIFIRGYLVGSELLFFKLPSRSYSYVFACKFRLYTICLLMLMICHLQASLWLCRVYFTSFSTVIIVSQQRSWQNPLDGTPMMLFCNTMYKSLIEFFAKNLKRKWRSVASISQFLWTWIPLLTDCCDAVIREPLWKVQYSSYLKGIIWTTLNALMWITNLVEKSHFMVLNMLGSTLHITFLLFLYLVVRISFVLPPPFDRSSTGC